MIDGNGNSTTGHFMAIAKDLNLGKIIGEEFMEVTIPHFKMGKDLLTAWKDR